jgi:heterodisulfide reductase subunit B
MKIGYFPGCSLSGTAREFDESVRAMAGKLDVDLVEIEDWACCGSSSAHSTDHLLSVALPARTLALAEEQGHDRILAPCAACYNRLASARHELGHDAALLGQVREILRREFSPSVAVLSIAELLRDMAPDIERKVERRLSGLKLACYYGCLLVRPSEVTGFDDAEAPNSLETVVAALGATAVPWHRKVDCCGGGMSLFRTGSVVRLGRSILEDAREAGAHAVLVACPMCHSNLDLRQRAISAQRGEELGMPILYVSQLVGLALGIDPRTLGLGRHFVSTASVLAQLETRPALTEGSKSQQEAG